MDEIEIKERIEQYEESKRKIFEELKTTEGREREAVEYRIECVAKNAETKHRKAYSRVGLLNNLIIIIGIIAIISLITLVAIVGLPKPNIQTPPIIKPPVKLPVLMWPDLCGL